MQVEKKSKEADTKRKWPRAERERQESQRQKERERPTERLTGIEQKEQELGTCREEASTSWLTYPPILLAATWELFPWLQLLCNCFLQLTDFIYLSAPPHPLTSCLPSHLRSPKPWLEETNLYQHTVHHFNPHLLEALKYIKINIYIYINI